MKKMIRRAGAMLLAFVCAFLCACGTIPATENEQVTSQTQETVEETTVQSEETVEESTETESKEPRYIVEWAKDAVIYEVNTRQYSKEGTFAKVTEDLERIKELGVTTIWLMPIYPISKLNRLGTLGSYYAVADYKGINSEYGTEEDLHQLIDTAHGLGLKVILDWVGNHTGWDNSWIKDHKDWYLQDSHNTVVSPPNMGWNDVAQLNYDNQELRAEMISCMKYWVTDFDVDGFRCDYASGVPVDFWEEARVELTQEKELFMLAEDNVKPSLLDAAFDCNYNWSLYDALKGVAKDTKNASFLKYYIPSDYPDGTFSMNFLDNHDKNSYEGTIVENFGADALPIMYSFIYTIPGMPLLYNGDEIGLNHALLFSEKDQIDWENTENDYTELLTYLATLRKENPALFAGNWGGKIEYLDTGVKNVVAFKREKDGNTIVGIFNMTKRDANGVDLSAAIQGMSTVLLYGQGKDTPVTERYDITTDDLANKTTLQAWEYWILTE